MTEATLSLDDLEPIRGTVEFGNSYIVFIANTRIDERQINGPHEGQLTIDSRDERVAIETYHAVDGGGCEMTLRRVTPST